MTQEDKELLLKDLCARLPYKVMLNCDNTNDEENNFRRVKYLLELWNL